jgi:hypothetical protein
LPLVDDPAQAIARITGRSRSRRLALIVAAGALVAVAGCGGGSSTQPQVDVGPNVGQPISLADCHDWNQANTEQRLGTIKQLKDFAGGPIVGNDATSPSGTGAVLDDKDAYNLFNSYCARGFSRGFKLYKLYERAAAFSGQPAQ